MKKIYLAGKVTGSEDYKTIFENAKQKIIKSSNDKNILIVIPALFLPDGFDYESYVRIGIAILAECNAICLLPDWEKSKGALAEYHVALALNKEILYLEN